MVITTLQSKWGTYCVKNITTILAATALLIAAASACAQDIRATVDGNLVSFPDVQPVMMNDRVMVPVRGVFEHMNADVKWDGTQNTVTAYRGTDTIELKLNSYTAMMNHQQMTLDSPAIMHQGRTLVPLRFLSEALGATVDWRADTRMVEIRTTNVPQPGYNMMRIEAGTVIPFQLKEKLTSNNSRVGDKFTASIDTSGMASYQGIPMSAVLEGHVDMARPKSGDTPGVLGLAFDRIRFADGRTAMLNGSLIGLDSDSVTNEDGRLVAKDKAKDDNLKYIGYGAGAGALVAILTKGNIITSSLIGAALGLLLGETQKDPKQARDVTLDSGSKFGVRLTRDMMFNMPMVDRS